MGQTISIIPGGMPFSKICGPNVNMNAIHHVLYSKKPTVFFLTESQILGKNDLILLKFPSYKMRLDGSVCLYIKNSEVIILGNFKYVNQLMFPP